MSPNLVQPVKPCFRQFSLVENVGSTRVRSGWAQNVLRGSLKYKFRRKWPKVAFLVTLFLHGTPYSNSVLGHPERTRLPPAPGALPTPPTNPRRHAFNPQKMTENTPRLGVPLAGSRNDNSVTRLGWNRSQRVTEVQIPQSEHGRVCSSVWGVCCWLQKAWGILSLSPKLWNWFEIHLKCLSLKALRFGSLDPGVWSMGGGLLDFTKPWSQGKRAEDLARERRRDDLVHILQGPTNCHHTETSPMVFENGSDPTPRAFRGFCSQGGALASNGPRIPKLTFFRGVESGGLPW